MNAAKIVAITSALAVASPSVAAAHGGVWAPPEREAAPSGWEDDAPIPPAPPGPAPTPAPATAPAPAPAPAAAPAPALAPPSEAKRRTGNGLLIGAGAMATVGIILNGTRAYIASGPCQERGQPACEEAWGFTSAFTWLVNVAALGMTGAGAGLRGSYDAAADPEAQQFRRGPFIAAGATLLVVGFATNVTLKSLWLADYSSPQGEETFDFAKPGHAFGYYGGLQLSSLAMAFGLGMLVHGTVRPRRAAHRRRTIVATPGPLGIGLSGRF